MNKKVIMGFFAGVVVVFMALFFIGSDDAPAGKSAAKAPAKASAVQASAAAKPQSASIAPAQASAKPVSQSAAVKDPRGYLTVEDMRRITGNSYKRTYVDMKYSGKPDLEFSTADEGHVALTVTVLPGSYYEKFYNDFRSQDYKPMQYAFWGPRNANPPKMLIFRKGGTMIVLTRYLDAGAYDVSVEMMERLASTVASRL